VESPASNEAGVKYFLPGSFASAFLIYGISLTYGIAGTTDLAGVAPAIPHSIGSNLLLVIAMELVAAGLASKVATVPLRTWALDAYQGATSPVAAFLAAGSKAVGLAMFGRVCLTAYGSQAQVLSVILGMLAGLSSVVGSIVALSQTDMKRLPVYSSIAHGGYALLGLIAGTHPVASATMTYAFF